MPRRKKAPPGPHIYWREQKGGPPRAYGDFRALPGGGREGLRAPGERSATTDPAEAKILFGKRLEELQSQAVQVAALAPQGMRTTLAQGVRAYLDYKGRQGRETGAWIEAVGGMLGRAIAFFGGNRPLVSIRPRELVRWLEVLAETPTARGKGYSPQSQRHHLAALSGLYSHAQFMDWVPQGVSPVARLDASHRPPVPKSETPWLEVHEAARLLDSARSLSATSRNDHVRMAYPLLATFLLTGGRADEVLGLDLVDVDFGAKVIHFRPNAHRRGKKGKTTGAERVVPLYPQLAGILRGYLEGLHLELRLQRPELTLLFPSPKTLGRITDFRKVADRCLRRAGLPTGLRSRAFRITFCSALIQTLDHGQPIAEATVQEIMGHADEAMIRRVYGKVGKVRHRSEHVEYRSGNAEGAERREEDRATPDGTLDWHSAPSDDITPWARRDSNARPLAPEASALSS